MSNNRSGGVSFTGVLAAIFIALRLAEVINWSWWWVLSPLWLPAAVGLGIGILAWIVERWE